jgi:hypothetical protein
LRYCDVQLKEVAVVPHPSQWEALVANYWVRMIYIAF